MRRCLKVRHTDRTEPQSHLQLLHIDRPAISCHSPAPPVNEPHCFLPSRLHLLPAVTQAEDLLVANLEIFNGRKCRVAEHGPHIVNHILQISSQLLCIRRRRNTLAFSVRSSSVGDGIFVLVLVLPPPGHFLQAIKCLMDQDLHPFVLIAQALG